jgi:hypothetical protein
MIEPSMEELILSGVVEVAGVDAATGEFLYNFTPKLRELMPEMYNERMEFIQNEVTFFLEEGFLEADGIGAKNPTIYLTEKSFDNEEIAQLSKDKQESLREIKRMFEEK